MKSIGFVLGMVLLLGAGCRTGGGVSPTQVAVADAEIRQMMDDSAAAWTANDLDGFMAGFHNSPQLRFATPGGITMGWDELRARYARSIEMSDLRFSDIDVQVLSPDAAVVFGRFHNDMKDGGYAHGLYTLLLRKIDGSWVIVHDHSSDLPVEGAE